MDAISCTTARTNLASTMDRVCNDRDALVINRKGKPSVVMLSLESFRALEETAHLLQTPANARRLLSAVRQLESPLPSKETGAAEHLAAIRAVRARLSGISFDHRRTNSIKRKGRA